MQINSIKKLNYLNGNYEYENECRLVYIGTNHTGLGSESACSFEI